MDDRASALLEFIHNILAATVEYGMTVQEAEEWLSELHDLGESLHPDDEKDIIEVGRDRIAEREERAERFAKGFVETYKKVIADHYPISGFLNGDTSNRKKP